MAQAWESVLQKGKTWLLTINKVLKVLKDPRLAAALLNAQLRMAARARVPLSVRLNGKVRITGAGVLALGEGITLCGTVVPIEFVSHKGARIIVGDHTWINYGSSVSAHELVSIGAHCLLGHYTLILDNNEPDFKDHKVASPSKPVFIEDHVWIGSHVAILPGVRIGHHAVIGAGSVVVHDIPAHCVAMGNPARVERSLE
jgi:acetyltransferase-like isoleucine patch superfamily enzyme